MAYSTCVADSSKDSAYQILQQIDTHPYLRKAIDGRESSEAEEETHILTTSTSPSHRRSNGDISKTWENIFHPNRTILTGVGAWWAWWLHDCECALAIFSGSSKFR